MYWVVFPPLNPWDLKREDKKEKNVLKKGWQRGASNITSKIEL